MAAVIRYFSGVWRQEANIHMGHWRTGEGTVGEGYCCMKVHVAHYLNSLNILSYARRDMGDMRV